MLQIKHFKATGSGPPPPPLDPLTEKILRSIDENTEVSSPFDCESASSRNADIVQESLRATLNQEDMRMLEEESENDLLYDQNNPVQNNFMNFNFMF